VPTLLPPSSDGELRIIMDFVPLGRIAPPSEYSSVDVLFFSLFF